MDGPGLWLLRNILPLLQKQLRKQPLRDQLVFEIARQVTSCSSKPTAGAVPRTRQACNLSSTAEGCLFISVQRRFHLYVSSRQVLGKAQAVQLKALKLSEAAMQHQQHEAPAPAPAASLLIRRATCMAGPVALGGLHPHPCTHTRTPKHAAVITTPRVALSQLNTHAHQRVSPTL